MKYLTRTGRPVKDEGNPRNNIKRLRMTDKEVEMLEYCCKHTGKTITEVLVLGVQKVYEELQGKKK